MKIAAYTPDATALEELGGRIGQARVRRGLTQRELAAEAGLGVATVKRLEGGQAVGTDNLVRVLRALALMEGLDQLVPLPPPSPLERLERAGGERRRVRRRRVRDSAGGWTWGDEPDAGPATQPGRARAG
jgi:transcriptional regulator with XRE-family HTH domain